MYPKSHCFGAHKWISMIWGIFFWNFFSKRVVLNRRNFEIVECFTSYGKWFTCHSTREKMKLFALFFIKCVITKRQVYFRKFWHLKNCNRNLSFWWIFIYIYCSLFSFTAMYDASFCTTSMTMIKVYFHFQKKIDNCFLYSHIILNLLKISIRNTITRFEMPLSIPEMLEMYHYEAITDNCDWLLLLCLIPFVEVRTQNIRWVKCFSLV